MASQDTNVNVQPFTGTGQKIRNLQLTVLDQTTNSFSNVLMQVVSIADADGQIINDFADKQWQQEVLMELKSIRMGIGSLIGNPFLGGGE